MSDTLTIIVSILVPTIGIQVGIMLFTFRRMDRMEERLTHRMDRADEDRAAIRAELRVESQSIHAEFSDIRTQIAALQTGVARLEGAVEILRGFAERISTAPH